MNATTNTSKAKAARGFTLIEMMVVIALIAALAAVSFPVYNGIKKKLEKQQFEMMLSSLEKAVDNFELEYNYLPYIGNEYPAAETPPMKNQLGDITAFTSVLTGVSNSAANFKKIQFFEYKGPSGEPGNYTDGLLISGNTATLYMPWGAEIERIYLDYNLDGSIPDPFDFSVLMPGYKLLLFSFGPDGIWGPDPSNMADNIYNFEPSMP